MIHKLPALQFYVGDWRKDPGVQSLDYETRGIWLEILCIMHESEDRGKLMLNGKPMPMEALCRLLGLDNQNLTKALTKILEYGVASIDSNSQIIFSRRMVRDEDIRKTRKECGKLGGNPNLVNQKPTTQDNQKSTPSSSSSSSVSYKRKIADSAKANPTEAAQDWIDSLKVNPAYQHINFEAELGKMKAWLSTKKGRKLTRPFILNWFNRIETPIEFKAKPKVERSIYELAFEECVKWGTEPFMEFMQNHKIKKEDWPKIWDVFKKNDYAGRIPPLEERLNHEMVN